MESIQKVLFCSLIMFLIILVVSFMPHLLYLKEKSPQYLLDSKPVGPRTDLDMVAKKKKKNLCLY
jgi:hypothetical protein